MDAPPSFGRYKVTGTLGSGAMGDVYAALDDVLGRSVAVKTLRSGSTGATARMLDERFRLEARAVAALNHPGIVQVYDLDLAANPPYLVMERMAGPSLSEVIKRGPLAPPDLRGLGIQIARAIAAAHAAGIVHRDVKPANILAGSPGMWKLADFGVAHVPDSSLTMTGQFIGSPAYAPPEALVRGQSIAAGDVFGLGATLYCAAAGKWPRAHAENTALLAPIPSVRTLAPELPDDLVATIDRAVELEPARRPTAVELAEALASATAPRPAPAVVSELSTATAVLGPATRPTSTATEVLPPSVPAATAPARAAESVFVPDARQAPAVKTSFVPDATQAPGPNAAFAPVPTDAPSPHTAFVPDATQAPGPYAFAPIPAGAPSPHTAFVPDAPRAPAAARRPRWLPWAALASAGLAVIVVVAATRGSDPAKPTTPTANPTEPATRTGDDRDPRSSDQPSVEPPAPPEQPSMPAAGGTESTVTSTTNGKTFELRIVHPRVSDPRAAEEFEAIVDDLYDRRYTYALEKLGDWERAWGATPETRSLRQQLEGRADQ